MVASTIGIIAEVLHIKIDLRLILYTLYCGQYVIFDVPHDCARSTENDGNSTSFYIRGGSSVDVGFFSALY